MVICEPQKKKKPIQGVSHIYLYPPPAISVLESSDLCHHTNYL